METGRGPGLLADAVCQRNFKIGRQSDRRRHRKAKGAGGNKKRKGA